MYGLGDVLAEESDIAHKLDDKVTEAKDLLGICKQVIQGKELDPLAKTLLLKQIDDYIKWKG